MEFPVHEKFSSPEAEIEYLRSKIAEKERSLAEIGYSVSPEAGAHVALEEYHFAPPSAVLPEERILSEDAVDKIILDIPPEKDDAIMGELLGIMHEKGLRNALLVVEKMDNPHITDDFHRVMVQYLHAGYPVSGLSEKEPVHHSLNMTLYEVTLPDSGVDAPENMAAVMEQLYAGLFGIGSGVSSDDTFALEIAVSAIGQEIVFYIATPTAKKGLFEKQLLSLFPHARIREEKGDYNIFTEQAVTLASTLSLAELPIYPLTTYEEFDADPLRVLLNAFSKIEKEGVGVAVQFIVHVTGEDFTPRYKRIGELLEKGMKVKDAYREVESGIISAAVNTLSGIFTGALTTTKNEIGLNNERKIDQFAIDGVYAKIKSPIVPVNIRIVVSAPNLARGEEVLQEIESSFHQFQKANSNRLTFTRAKGSALRGVLTRFTFREFSQSEAIPLSLTELASLIHFPAPGTTASPEFRQSHATHAAAPLDLPGAGTLLGRNFYRDVATDIFLAPEDRLRHFYVIGQTGTGKTTLLKNMIVQDIAEGAGICFIDPHGSDVQDILASIPKSRLEDVIYFDPAYVERVMGLNMLEFDPTRPEQKTFVVNELFSIFKKLYGAVPESMGPAFEQYFRNATLLVLEHPESGMTLLDISRVLADSKYRALKLSHSRNPVVNQFWQDIATKAQGEASLANMVPYIVNKFDIFTANEYMRPIIAQEHSAFNFREVMDERKILLINLSKGRLGDINANLLGLIIVGKILMAALSRVDLFQSGKDMAPFYLYIDEFQNVTTDSIATILSEARKYRLGLTVAHQFIAQLQENIKNAVFGNVGSLAVFRVGADDAKVLESQFAPTFSANDIMNIDNRNAYIKMLANGKPAKPFDMETIAPSPGTPEQIEYIKQLSYLKYGKPRAEVEADITARYKKEAPPVSPPIA